MKVDNIEKKKGLTYAEACEQASKGEMIARTGWGYCNKSFVFERPADTLAKDFIPKVKSIPEKVKNYLVDEMRDIEFTAYLCKWEDDLLEDGKVINGWRPSPMDLTTDDWHIME